MGASQQALLMRGVSGDDPYFSFVTALLHFNGTDGSTTFTDVIGNTWSAVGNAQLDTADSKFGGAALLLDGTGDYSETAVNANLAANADYTIECWIKSNAPSSTKLIATKRPSATQVDFQLLTLGNKVYLDVFCAGSTILSLTGTTTVGSGWRHVAATKSGTTWRIFLDGNLEASGNEPAAYTDGGNVFRIGGGGAGGGSWDWNGWIDEFRITKGVARYTASFTAPTTPFPDS